MEVIPIQTYYQKHRQIKAFQFDGTLQQLRYELPNYLFKRLIYPDTDSKYDIQYGHNNLIKSIKMDTSVWPQSNCKLKNAHYYWKKHYRFASFQQAMWIRKELDLPFQYTHHLNPLRKNDYVVIKHRWHSFIPETKLYRSPTWRDRQYYLIPSLIIDPKQNFEAHWSKHPIQ